VKIIITITDNPGNKVGVRMDFKPHLATKDKPTPATGLAFVLVERIAQEMKYPKTSKVFRRLSGRRD
jgi:hypothetical protein